MTWAASSRPTARSYTTTYGVARPRLIPLGMGNLFEDSDEYPDYLPMPRFTARIGDTVIPLAIAATLHGICPVVLEDHSHPAHEDHSPKNVRLNQISVSSTSSNSTIAVPAGSTSFTGYAPTLAFGSTRST